MTVDTEFDPTRYGMAAEYDDQGNYIYPEGFDVDTGEWREGFEAQRETWEREYAEAHVRYSTSRRSGRPRRWMPTPTQARPPPVPRTTRQGGAAPAESSGSLASDEQLAALREKLSGGA